MLFFFSFLKGNTKQIAVLYDRKKKNFQKEREILFPDFTFEPEAIPTSLQIPTRSLQKLEASKSGERYQAVVLQVDLSKETALVPMKPSSERLQTKIGAPVDRIWSVYPNTQVLPLITHHPHPVGANSTSDISSLASSPLGCENSSPGSPRGRADSLVTLFQVPKKPFPP